MAKEKARITNDQAYSKADWLAKEYLCETG